MDTLEALDVRIQVMVTIIAVHYADEAFEEGHEENPVK
jgi:hypothetical protein